MTTKVKTEWDFLIQPESINGVDSMKRKKFTSLITLVNGDFKWSIVDHFFSTDIEKVSIAWRRFLCQEDKELHDKAIRIWVTG